MALDASIGNRAKEGYSLIVDYGTICKTSNESEIRNMLSLECSIIDWFETLSDEDKDKIKKGIDIFSKFSDRELAEQRNDRSKILKKHI